LKGNVAFYVRAGNNANVVAEDSVNGVTTPLCCIGIVTNTTGTITCAGYNAVTAPNGSDITNRLSTAVALSTVPANSTQNGSVQSVTDLLRALSYTVGQLAWKGSQYLTPSAANNYGAYSLPAGGLDAAYRGLSGVVTIGNGTTVIGDFNTSDYARADLLMTAVLAVLPADGGTVVLKRGVQLTNWNTATWALPAGKTLEVVGSHSDVPSTTPQLVFAQNESWTANATGKLVLRNVHVRWVSTAFVLSTNAPATFVDCFFEKNIAAADLGACIQGSQCADVRIQRCVFVVNQSATTALGMCFRATGQTRRIRVSDVRITTTGADCSGIQLSDMREDCLIEDVRLDATTMFTGFSAAVVVDLTP
jgi:hypothetical protein